MKEIVNMYMMGLITMDEAYGQLVEFIVRTYCTQFNVKEGCPITVIKSVFERSADLTDISAELVEMLPVLEQSNPQ